VAQFLTQHYPPEHRRLIVLDDGDQLSGGGHGWKIVTVRPRYANFWEKYRTMIDLSQTLWPGWKPDAVALFDDDDIYGPFYLLSHDLVLHDHYWSHPLQVHSLYGVDTGKGELPITEPSGGRFFQCAALRMDFLAALGNGKPSAGWDTTLRADGDQLNLHKWYHSAVPGRPDWTDCGKQFVYGWGRSKHLSGGIKTATDIDAWYNNYTKMDDTNIDNLQPLMDTQTKLVYEMLWCGTCPSTTCKVRT
jgi:hypothetical protein